DMWKYLYAVVSITFLFVFADKVSAYEVINVGADSTVRGTVTFKGDVPENEMIRVTEDTGFCGEEIEEYRYQVLNFRVRDVVVWIEDVSRGKAIPESQVSVTFDKCMVQPHVSIGFVGGDYLFRNEDSILHTVQLKLGLAYQKQVSGRPLTAGATIYNIALPRKRVRIRKPIKRWHRHTEKTGFIQIRSSTHYWINGFIFVFDHPYAAVTGQDGTFVIDGLLPGDYVLKAWHEGFGLQEGKIKVETGKILQADIQFGK
ncbi:MAG: carboxypeptidase-like regulatory domain-containing protein, partial [bacterium]